MGIELHKQVLKEYGLIKIAEVNYEFKQRLWWHPEDKLEISVIQIEPYLLIKGIKHYVLKAITPEGELYIRDLNGLHEYLESHFSEIHISFSHFRDIDSQQLILKRIKDRKLRYSRNFVDTDLHEREAGLEKIKEEFNLKKDDMETTKALLNLTQGKSSLANRYLKTKLHQSKIKLEDLSGKGRQIEKNLFHSYKLLKEYRKKGSGAAFIFSYSSDLLACYVEDFKDALSATIKDLQDMHNFQIRQKLFGGKLNIFVEETEHPALAYQFEWAGGALNPNQLKKLGPEFDGLRKCTEDYLMLIPSKNIIVDGQIRDEKKLCSAKVLQNFFRRLDKVPKVSVPKDIPSSGGWIGNIIAGNEVTDIPLLHPIQMHHCYVSGTTRAGKTFLARVIVENCIIEGVTVIILDPGQQWFGLTRPALNENVLKRYDRLGINRCNARGFDANIYIPGSDSDYGMPEDLGNLLHKNSIISFRYCTDLERCRITSGILKKIYNSLERESEKLKVMIVFEEAHLFTQSGVIGEAKEAAQEVGIIINRIAREKAKFGCIILIISQSLSDFKREAKNVREMINTRMFLRATDNAEFEYIENYVSKEAKEIVKNLKQGEALVHGYAIPNPSGVKVYVRPPFSHVGELSDLELKEIVQSNEPDTYFQQGNSLQDPAESYEGSSDLPLTEREKAALRIIQEHYEKHNRAITAIELGNRMGLQGGSRQRIIDNLVQKKLVKTTKIPNVGRGRPIQGITPLC